MNKYKFSISKGDYSKLISFTNAKQVIKAYKRFNARYSLEINAPSGELLYGKNKGVNLMEV
jgi:hypothetical protein